MDRDYLENLSLFQGFECANSKIPLSILEEIVSFHELNYTVPYDDRLNIIFLNNSKQKKANKSILMPKKEIIKDRQKRGNLVFFFQDLVLHEIPGKPHVLSNASFYRFDGRKFTFIFLRPSIDSYVFDIMTFSQNGFFDFNVDQAVGMFYLGASMWKDLHHATPAGFEIDLYRELYKKEPSNSISRLVKENVIF